MGPAEPGAPLCLERSDRGGRRAGGLVDSALRFARFPIFVSDDVGCWFPAPVGDRSTGRDMRRSGGGVRPVERFLRAVLLEMLALAGCGLFVAELVRNRRLSAEVQQKLRALVETSPAAIVTVDDRGFIDLANQAAAELLAPRDGRLIGNPVAAFLPELHHALRRDGKTQFRAALECKGHKGIGETFTASVWFSTYRENGRPKLAAIIADVTEVAPVAAPQSWADLIGLNVRESDVLRLLVQGLPNREIAAKMSISESSVKNTLHALFAKSGVRTRSQLVRVALEQYRNLL